MAEIDKKELNSVLKEFIKVRNVNRFKLEVETEKQTSLYGMVSDVVSDLKEIRDELKNQIDRKAAKLELDLFEEPPIGKDKKPVKLTVALVKAYIVDDDDLYELQEQLQEVNSYLYKFESKVASLEHRRSSLNNLTSLYIAGYYSIPDSSKKTTNGSDSVRKGMNKNKRTQGEE